MSADREPANDPLEVLELREEMLFSLAAELGLVYLFDGDAAPTHESNPGFTPPNPADPKASPA